MNVLHIGHFSLNTINGSYNALWTLAKAQAAAGHSVTILALGKQFSPEDTSAAQALGIALDGLALNDWRWFWRDEGSAIRNTLRVHRPDIVHLQYVRIPRLYGISRVLRRTGIPYVVSLHGGLDPVEMTRRRYRKLLYWSLLERQIHRHAAGLHFVSDAERASYHNLPGASNQTPEAVIPNVVEFPETPIPWNPQPKTPLRIGYLGRFDVWHKGLDLACELIDHLNTADIASELHLYGSARTRDQHLMVQLRRRYGPYLQVHDPVFQDAKYRVLQELSFYLQYSRFELFGMSLVEAMSIGVPSIISERCDLAPTFASTESALVVPLSPLLAAQQIVEAVRRPGFVTRLSQRGRFWVRTNCEGSHVVTMMDEFYERVLSL